MFFGKPQRRSTSGTGRLLLTLVLLWAFCLNQEKLPTLVQSVWERSSESELASSRSQDDASTQADSTDFSASEKGFSPFSHGHFTLLDHTLGEWRFRFELGDYRIEEVEREDGTYSLVHSDDAWLLEQRGKPALPTFRTDFAIPTNALCRLEIISSEQESVACAAPLPSPGPLPRQSPPPPPASPEASIYQGAAPFPATLTRLTSTYQLREVSGVGIQVTPMQYLPQEGKLLVSRSFEAVLRMEPAEEPNPQLDENASFAFLQQQNFLNGRQLTRAAASTVGTLLLLLPDGWEDAAADFVLWKKRVGFKVHTASYPSDTGAGSENIASHIAAYYAAHAATHVILCGDWDKIPPWRLSSKAGGEAPSPLYSLEATTDAPYALLNGQSTDAPDFMADILLSRISADSATQLTDILSKLQLHERGHADSNWRNKGLFMASGDKYGSFNWNNDFIEGDNKIVQEDHVYIERLRQILLNNGVFTDGDTLYAGSSPTPTSALVSASLNSGTSLFYYLGHGSYSSFLTSGFDVNAARSLSNENALPFVVSPVCHTGNFAITAGDCLSEALLKHTNGGAAAIIASSGETYWRAPIVLLWKFTDSLLPERAPLPDAGSATLNSIIEGIRYCQNTSDDEEGSQNYFFELMHLFGDASQTLRLGTAKNLQVEQERTANRLRVRVFRQQNNEQIPVSGARVCLSYGKPESYISACSDDSGEVLLPLEENTLIYTLRVLEPGSQLWESPHVDNDGDGQISHQELLAWLSEWENSTEKPEGILAAAIAQWQASGSATSSRKMSTTTADAPVYPPVELRLQIFCQDRQELQRLAATGANLTGFENNIAFVECTSAFAESLAQDNFSIVASEPVAAPSTRDLSEYPNYEQVREKLLDIAAQYPQLCRMSFVGKSVQSREILALRLSLTEADSPAPELLIAGGLHGDEPPGTEMIMRLLEYLCEESDDEDIARLLQSCVLWLIPLMNPDGLELGTRGNANNADLNRDFPDGAVLGDEFGSFAEGSSLRLESLQPEQVAIMRWLAARRITAALHLHTGALKVCYPYGNYISNLNEAISPHDEIFHALSLHYVGLNDMMTEAHVINAAAWYPVTGELADWQYRFLGTLPLTVELGGPAWNKAPAYSTMETLFAANLPALLGWMKEVQLLYPQGLDWPDSSGQGTWQPELVFERQQYLPGYDNLARVKFKGLDEATPTALILVTETPADWEISELPGTLSPLASRKDSEQQSAWLFYPGETGWESDETLFNLLPPENTAAEAIFASTLHWDNGSGNCPDTHWLPLPERDFAMTWSYGWNAFSLPIIRKASQESPFTSLWEWQQNIFVPTNETQLGKGYFGFAESSGSFTFNGWMSEENPPATQTGWNLKGVLWEKLASLEEQVMIQPSKNAPTQLTDRKIQPGKAFWHLRQEKNRE